MSASAAAAKKVTINKKSKKTEAHTSDSDKEFVDNLNNDNNNDTSSSSDVSEGDKAKANFMKKFDTVASSLNSILTKFSAMDLNEEEVMVLSEKIGRIGELHSYCNKNLTAIVCGKKLEPSEAAPPQKKKSAKKEIKLDENGIPIPKDTSNAPINKKKVAFPEVLVFMELPEDTLVSSADVQRSMFAFLKEQKSLKNENNVTGTFKELLEAITSRHDKDEEVPNKIDNKMVYKYVSYCFPKVTK